MHDVISIRAAAGGTRGEIEVFGDLDDWGFAKAAFNRSMRDLKDAKEIVVRIDSYGGNAFDGLYIHDTLRNHPAHVTTTVVGVALSAASMIAMAGDDREMVENGFLMIHDSWGHAMGGADELENYAGLMRKINAQYAAVYSRVTGIPVSEIEEMMAVADGSGTWMTAAEAMAMNFATRVLAPVKIAARFDRDQIAARFTTMPEAARRVLGLNDTETVMDPNDKGKGTSKGVKGEAGASTGDPVKVEEVTADDPNEVVVETATRGFMSALSSLFRNPTDDGKGAMSPSAAAKSAAGAKGTTRAAADDANDDNPDIAATVEAALDRRLSALASPDGPVAKTFATAVATAVSAAVAPITAQVTALSTHHNTTAASVRRQSILSRLSTLVATGRVTPAQSKAHEPLLLTLIEKGVEDKVVDDFLDTLAKTPSLAAAASAIGPRDPDTGDVMDLPAELNPPAALGMAVDPSDLKVVQAAWAEAAKVEGSPEAKYKAARAAIYRAEGAGLGRTSLAFTE